MDNIKLYTKNEQDINSLINLARILSSKIGMLFQLDECSIKEGKIITTEGVKLPEGNSADIKNSNKYLGIPQANGNYRGCEEVLNN